MCDANIPNSNPALGRTRTGIIPWLAWSRTLNILNTGSGAAHPNLPSDVFPAINQFEPNMTARQIRERWFILVGQIADAGATRLMVTAKDHAGWTHWQSEVVRNGALWGVSESATPTANPIEYAAEACLRYGITLDLYFSHTDHMINPTNINGELQTEAHLSLERKHVGELLTQYGTIGAMWIDKKTFGSGQTGLYTAIKSIQPNCVVVANVAREKFSDDGCGGASNPDIDDGESDSISAELHTVASGYTMPHDQVMGPREDLTVFRANFQEIDAALNTKFPVVNTAGYLPTFTGNDEDRVFEGSHQALYNRVTRSTSQGGSVTMFIGPGPQGVSIPPYVEILRRLIRRQSLAGHIGDGASGTHLS